MSLILAIEPDPRQAAQITAIARNRVGAELRLAATTEQALDVIGDRVPDLVLVPALLSPQDDAALAAALRVIAAAAHVRTLTIPVLASGIRRESQGGMLAKWRKSKPEVPAPDGCDPAVFAEEISSYLREAAAERESRRNSSFEDESSSVYEPVEVAETTDTSLESTAFEPKAFQATTPVMDEEPRLVQSSAYAEPQFFDERPIFDERPVFEQQPVVEDRPSFDDQTMFEERPILFGKHFDDEPLVDEPARFWEAETIRHETILHEPTAAAPEPVAAATSDFLNAIGAPERNVPEAVATPAFVPEPFVVPAPEATEPPVVLEPEPIVAANELNASPFFQSEPLLATAPDASESVTGHESPLSSEPEPVEPPAVETSPAFATTTVVEPPVFATEPILPATEPILAAAEPMLAAAEPIVDTPTIEDLAEEEADESLTVSVEASFEDQEPVIPAAAPWIEFDLSDELGDGDEPVFELEAGDATAMLFEDPAFAAFAAAPPKPAAPVAPPVETDFERRLAAYDEPAPEEGDTIAEIFAALSNVDQFIVGNERPVAAPAIVAAAPARHVEFFAPTGLAGYRWPRIEGIASEVIDRREHKHEVTGTTVPVVVAAAAAAVTPRTARPTPKAETHKADRPEWSELIASLRQDIERLRGANQAPVAAPVAARPSQPAPPRPSAPTTEPAAAKPKAARGRKPIQDEWGFFDPEQCGFAALVAKLSEITDNNEETELHAH